MTVTLSVEVHEGTFVYVGQHNNGAANWRFLKTNAEGVMVSAPVPKRWVRTLKGNQNGR